MKTLIAAIFLCSCSLASAAINVCIDADGKKTFTDQACSKFSLKDTNPQPVVVAAPTRPAQPYVAPPLPNIVIEPSSIKDPPQQSIWFVRHRTDYPLLILIGAFLFPVVFILLWYVFDFGNRRKRRMGVDAAAKP
ncbi:DUF4124 domain-containing protein [Undibacterium terreum]|uniref:DUF4124 domain-containing protein n=1 Tax=Undibacterium terreum TaxID=1224302 RepID=UPI00166C0A50|nr:DUF4124 domain-containing protein [Undibacterium terreum]